MIEAAAGRALAVWRTAHGGTRAALLPRRLLLLMLLLLAHVRFCCWVLLLVPCARAAVTTADGGSAPSFDVSCVEGLLSLAPTRAALDRTRAPR